MLNTFMHLIFPAFPLLQLTSRTASRYGGMEQHVHILMLQHLIVARLRGFVAHLIPICKMTS